MKDWNQFLAIKECTGVGIGLKLIIAKPIKLEPDVPGIYHSAIAVNS
jgi:hypothetical protein